MEGHKNLSLENLQDISFFPYVDIVHAFHCPYTQTLSLQSMSKGKSNEEVHVYSNRVLSSLVVEKKCGE